jgi:hypothetical protein
MATATAVPAASPHAVTPPHGVKKDETEKERADRELKDRIEIEGPSPLRVPPQKSEVDRLRDEGVATIEVAVAPLPGGGPSTEPGMSAGGRVPIKDDVQEYVDVRSDELQKEQTEQRKKDEDKRAKDLAERQKSRKPAEHHAVTPAK